MFVLEVGHALSVDMEDLVNAVRLVDPLELDVLPWREEDLARGPGHRDEWCRHGHPVSACLHRAEVLALATEAIVPETRNYS